MISLFSLSLFLTWIHRRMLYLHTYAFHISEPVMIQGEHTGESARSGSENIICKKLIYGKGSTPEYQPAKLLLNGVGWSIPQSQGNRSAKNLMSQRKFSDVHRSPVEMHAVESNFAKFEPWFWFPSVASSWDGPDFLARVGGLKDEHPWKIRASVVHSVRAHHGAVRSLAFSQDECMVFTAGVGPGFKGTVQKWELARLNSVSSYYGHEEVCCFSYLVFRMNLLWYITCTKYHPP